MRRFLTDLLMFALLTLLIYVVLVVITGTISHASRDRNLKYPVANDEMMLNRVREVAQHPSTDILVVGSSHAYRGVDPRIFARHGSRLFNLGSSIQTPLQTEVLLRHHLAVAAPRLTLIETYPNGFNHSGLESTLDLLANDRVDASVAYLALRTANITVWNTLLFAGYREAFHLPKPPPKEVASNGDRYVSGGFVERHESGFRSSRTTPFTTWTPLPDQLEALERVIRMLRDSGSHVVLFRAPVMLGFRYTPGVEARIDRTLDIQGTAYLDMHDLFPPNDTTLFYDSHHLNQRGVELFNAELIRRLAAANHLDTIPGHRSDP